jgi:hypothetical protein
MRNILTFLLVYALWLLSSAVALVVAWVIRQTYLLVAGVLLSDPDLTSSQLFNANLRANAVDRWAILVLGVMIVVLVVYVEHYYRTGAAKGKLLQHFLRVSSYQVGVMAAFHLTYLGVGLGARLLTVSGALLPLGELALTLILVWLSRRLAPRTRPRVLGI